MKDHPTSPDSVQELGAVREPNQVGPSIRDPTRVYDSVERFVLVSTCRSRTRSLHKILETRSGSKLVGTHLCLFHLEGLVRALQSDSQDSSRILGTKISTRLWKSLAAERKC